MDVKTLLAELEAALARIDDAGIRYLSVAPAHEPFAHDAPEREAAAPAQPHPAAPAAGRPAAPAGRGADPPQDASPPRPPSELATLEALQFEFRDCRACKLAKGRHRVVFGTGAARPQILFIGEGPGADEDQQGLPFVGRAGALLTGFISALGLTREDVYITNVVKCRPPGNRTPEPDEIASCRPILMRQIELLDPRLIVTLGNVPLKALNPGAAGITKERGRLFPFQRWNVLPTFHPSYLLRNPRDIPICWLDFRRAFREAYPETDPPVQ